MSQQQQIPAGRRFAMMVQFCVFLFRMAPFASAFQEQQPATVTSSTTRIRPQSQDASWFTTSSQRPPPQPRALTHNNATVSVDKNGACFGEEVLTAMYNDNLQVIPYSSFMFNVGARDKNVELTALEIDVRQDLIPSSTGEIDETDLGIEIYWCSGCEEDDYERGGFYNDPTAWSLGANVNLIPHPTDPSRFLVPAHAFDKLIIPKQTNLAFYLRTKSRVAWIDNTVDTFVKSNEIASGISTGSSNLNIFSGFQVLENSANSGADWNPATSELDRTVSPIFAGKFYLNVQSNFCGFLDTLETQVEFIHVLENLDESTVLDLIGLEEDVAVLVQNTLQDDLILASYAEHHQLRADEEKVPKTFFRRFDGTCPDDWDNCQAHVIRIFLKHEESLSRNAVLAQVTKHAQYMTQLLQTYVDRSPQPSGNNNRLRLYNAGYRAAQAQFRLTLLLDQQDASSSFLPEPTIMDESQLKFFSKQVTAFLTENIPTSFVAIYEMHITDQLILQGRRRHLRPSQLQNEEPRQLQSSPWELQLSGYWQGAQFALSESRQEFADRIRTLLQVDGSTTFLDQVKFEVHLPGDSMEFNNRHVLFQHVTDMESFVDGDFGIAIPWAEGRERPDEFDIDSSTDSDSAKLRLVWILLPILLVCLAGGLVITYFFHKRHKRRIRQRKEREKAMGIDLHEDYYCATYNAGPDNYHGKSGKGSNKGGTETPHKSPPEEASTPNTMAPSSHHSSRSPGTSAQSPDHDYHNHQRGNPMGMDPNTDHSPLDEQRNKRGARSMDWNEALPSYDYDDDDSGNVAALAHSYGAHQPKKKNTEPEYQPKGLLPRTFGGATDDDPDRPPIDMVLIPDEEREDGGKTRRRNESSMEALGESSQPSRVLYTVGPPGGRFGDSGREPERSSMQRSQSFQLPRSNGDGDDVEPINRRERKPLSRAKSADGLGAHKPSSNEKKRKKKKSKKNKSKKNEGREITRSHSSIDLADGARNENDNTNGQRGEYQKQNLRRMQSSDQILHASAVAASSREFWQDDKDDNSSSSAS